MGVSNRLMAPTVHRQQNALLRMFPACGFAKYDRSKPHLNVGTIGKYCSLAGHALLRLTRLLFWILQNEFVAKF